MSKLSKSDQMRGVEDQCVSHTHMCYINVPRIWWVWKIEIYASIVEDVDISNRLEYLGESVFSLFLKISNENKML